MSVKLHNDHGIAHIMNRLAPILSNQREILQMGRPLVSRLHERTIDADDHALFENRIDWIIVLVEHWLFGMRQANTMGIKRDVEAVPHLLDDIRAGVSDLRKAHAGFELIS